MKPKRPKPRKIEERLLAVTKAMPAWYMQRMVEVLEQLSGELPDLTRSEECAISVDPRGAISRLAVLLAVLDHHHVYVLGDAVMKGILDGLFDWKGPFRMGSPAIKLSVYDNDPELLKRLRRREEDEGDDGYDGWMKSPTPPHRK